MQPVLVPHSAPAAPSEQRVCERFGVSLPYTIDAEQGHTSDLSSTGVAFESSTRYAPGDRIRMTVRYGLDGHNLPLPCELEVVRVERHGEEFKIGARLIRPFFDAEA